MPCDDPCDYTKNPNHQHLNHITNNHMSKHQTKHNWQVDNYGNETELNTISGDPLILK